MTTSIDIRALNADRAEGNTGVSPSTPFTFEVTRSGDTASLLSLNFDVGGSGADPAEADDFIGTGVQTVTTQNSTTVPGTGQPLAVGLTLPDASTAGSVNAFGFVSSGDIPEPPINIAYVIDVSGSTFNNFSGTTTVGDRNGDGTPNDIIDAIIEGFDTLNQQIAAIDFGVAVNAALIPFSSTSGIASVQQPSQDANANGKADLIDLLETADSSATLGGVNVGGGTDFPDGLQEAVNFFNAQPAGDNFVFFLSDGQNNGGSFTSQVNELLGPTIDAQIAAFGVGSGANMDQIDLVDDGLDNDSRTDADRVLDPQTLVAQLTLSPVTAAEVARVELFVNNVLSATIPSAQLVQTPLGLSYNANLSGLSLSADDVIQARVVASDGAATTVSTQQTVENLTSTGLFPAGSVTFAPGVASQNVTIGVVGDTTFEGDEGFTVTLSQGNQPVQFFDSTASGVIRNDDTQEVLLPVNGNIRGTDRDDGLLVVQGANYLGGDGDDFYVLSQAIAPFQTSVINDNDADEIELVNGLEIASSTVTANAIQLTLVNGAVVQILNAASYSYDVGGNATTGTVGQVLDFASFAQDVLGVAVPASGFATGGPVTIGQPTGTVLAAPGSVAATSDADVFVLRVDDGGIAGGIVTNPDFDGSLTISGFDPAIDILRFVNEPGSTVDAADLLNQTGLDVLQNPFTNTVTYALGDDPAVPGLDGASVVIEGLSEQDADGNGVLDFVEIA